MDVPSQVLKIAEDIKSMKVRGAGRIAREAARALIIFSEQSEDKDVSGFMKKLDYVARLLINTRPTAVSLPNAIRYVLSRAYKTLECTSDVEKLREVVVYSARKFISDSLVAVERIGDIGSKLVKDGMTILTHCHSTAVISILKHAWFSGKRFNVICTETRPKFQGRITARILSGFGIPTTLIVDGATRYFMHDVDVIFVGADAIASNGALVNKIGTSMIALAAREARKPFFVAAETYKFAPETLSGKLIKVEERPENEVLPKREIEKMKGVSIRNPAFDLTPPQYITAIITERGVIPPQAAVSILVEFLGWSLEQFSKF